MKFDKSLLKKASTYAFGVFALLCISMFVFALVKVLSFTSGGNASTQNLFQIGFSACTLLVLCLFVSFLLLSKFEMSEFLKITILCFIFVFFGVFSCFGLYALNIALFVFFGILGFVCALLCISIFFHLSKSQDGTLKANSLFLLLFVIGFSTFIVALVEIFVFLITMGMDSKLLFTTKEFVIAFACGLFGATVVGLISVISLMYGKKFVNMCLILKRK